jgi:hypothetical protein
MIRRRRVGFAVFGTVASMVAVVVSHDYYQAASLSSDLLCERSDGSFWRDPSHGCYGHEDPRCTYETDCADPTITSEGWRHACTWILFDREVSPVGQEPFYEGPSPGRGCLGRK